MLGSVAQLVEQRTENPRVGGSIPSRTTISRADVVQLVERQLPKLKVAGSSPVIRSIHTKTEPLRCKGFSISKW